MNKHLLSAAAALAVSSPVWAQSNIGLYGIVDGSVVNVSNVSGKSRFSIDSGYLQTSRFGVKGERDLGNGLSGIFLAEAGFNLDNGTTGTSTPQTSATSSPAPTIFNRQTYFGLNSNELGRLTLGKQYSVIYDQLILLSGAPAFGVSGGAVDGIPSAGSSASRFDNTLGGTRTDNSLKYNSPKLAGWRFDAMYGAGEVAGASSTAGNYVSLGGGYNEGPVQVGLGYQVRNCGAATGCTATQGKDEVIALGGGYKFSAFKLAAIYTTQKNAKNVKGNDANVLHTMVQVPVGKWLLSAGYQQLSDRTALKQDVNQFNLSALYSLDEKTTFYAAFAQQKVANGGKAGMALTTSSNDRQNVIAGGVRYTF